MNERRGLVRLFFPRRGDPAPREVQPVAEVRPRQVIFDELERIYHVTPPRRERPSAEEVLELARQRNQRKLERAEANERADALLARFLNEAQQETYTSTDRFVEVAGSDGGRFCLWAVGYDNITVLEISGHDHCHVYCSYMAADQRGWLERIEVPIGDQVLAHKLMLETDEARFRLTAPRSQLLGPQQQTAELARHRH